MKFINSIMSRYKVKLVALVQLILCAVLAIKAIDKDIKTRLKITEQNAKKDAKRNNRVRKLATNNAMKIAKADYKYKLTKLKIKNKKLKAAGRLAAKKYKNKLRKG